MGSRLRGNDELLFLNYMASECQHNLERDDIKLSTTV
jgi:hypothetical protein